MRLRTLHLTLATVVAAIVAACSDATSPGVPTGTFTLRSIDGQPLPVLVNEDPAGARTADGLAREYTDAVTLVVGPGLDTLRVRYHLVASNPDTGEDPAPLSLASELAVDARADRLCIRLEVPGQSECEGPVWVRRTRDEIVVRLFPGIYPAADGEYRFVREGR